MARRYYDTDVCIHYACDVGKSDAAWQYCISYTVHVCILYINMYKYAYQVLYEVVRGFVKAPPEQYAYLVFA